MLFTTKREPILAVSRVGMLSALILRIHHLLALRSWDHQNESTGRVFIPDESPGSQKKILESLGPYKLRATSMQKI